MSMRQTRSGAIPILGELDQHEIGGAPDVHPLANEIVDDPEMAEGGRPTVLHDRIARETLRDEFNAPTSATRKRQMVIAWTLFLIWCALVVGAFAVVALIRGTIDIWSLAILVAIPIGLLFTMPVWIAEEVKHDQDEAIRRITRTMILHEERRSNDRE